MRTKTISLALVAALAAAVPAAAQEQEGPHPRDHKMNCTIKPKKRYNLNTLIKRGLDIPVTCDAPGRIAVGMEVQKPDWVWARMPKFGIFDASGHLDIAKPGDYTVRIKLARRARKGMRRDVKRISVSYSRATGPAGSNRLWSDGKGFKHGVVSR
jgi:hypothetical protein